MSQSTKKLGAAIFGAGWVAGEHARAYQACPRTHLVAVGSRKEESARKCAEYAGVKDAFITTDFDALLRRPDVDVISITTPPDIHPQLTIKAARAGKHICIEKPIALDWKSCLEMQKVVKETGVKTIVSFCLHWNPSLLNTSSLINQGAIGKPYYIEVDYWHGMKPWYPQYPWSVKKPQGGSSLLSTGCHASSIQWADRGVCGGNSGWQAGGAGYQRCCEDARADFRGGSIGGDGEDGEVAAGTLSAHCMF